MLGHRVVVALSLSSVAPLEDLRCYSSAVALTLEALVLLVAVRVVAKNTIFKWKFVNFIDRSGNLQEATATCFVLSQRVVPGRQDCGEALDGSS